MWLCTEHTLDLEICSIQKPDLLSFIIDCFADEIGSQIRNANFT